MYALVYCIVFFFSFWLISLCIIGSSFIHLIRTDANIFFLMPVAGALGQPRGMVRGGRRQEGSGWETHVYLWQIHFDIWQTQYNIVKLKNKIKFKK